MILDFRERAHERNLPRGIWFDDVVSSFLLGQVPRQCVDSGVDNAGHLLVGDQLLGAGRGDDADGHAGGASLPISDVLHFFTRNVNSRHALGACQKKSSDAWQKQST
jgi:hypothetical protein